ncbi:uncharacterized protein [Dermacentor albipictus]|uniref:uncharacterized protein n=1 Tax=Dermacentor albipictus TaxID=60249 RepID=UPI0031FBA974
MATPTPKSRQSKITDKSKENQESHEGAAVSLKHSKDVSESSKPSRARVVDSVQHSKQTQPAAVDTAVAERRHSASKSPAGGRSGSVSEKPTSPRSVEKPEPAPRDKHQQDHTSSKLSAASNAAKGSQKEHHRTSEGATPTSRRSAGEPEKPIAAPRSQPERRSPQKPSSSATTDKMSTSAAYSELHQRPESSSDVLAWHGASGRTTSRELVPREQRIAADGGPFLSTPTQRSVTPENEGFITEMKAVSSKPQTPSKHRASASSDTAKLPDMRKSSSADEPTSGEQFEAAPSKKPSSSATPDKMPTRAAYSELQQRPESSSDVVLAGHGASGRTESREQRIATDRSPFSSTPRQRSVTPENEGFITEMKAVSSKPETPSKHRASASSDTAKLPDMPKSSSADKPPSEEQFEAAPSSVTQKKEEQPARMPLWQRPLTRSPNDRSADAESKKTAPLPLSAKDINSFAYKTVRDRLPVILTKVIDTVFRDRMEIERVLGLEAREETKLVVARLAKLRNEMVTNKPMVRIEDDFEDADIWNSVLNEYATKHSCKPRWFEAPWLYIETYFYRRIFEAFQLTTKLRDYDPFNKLKRDALYGSFSAVRALCDFLRRDTPRDATVETLQPTTYRLIEVSLWGNRCDLSLSCGADRSSQAGSLQQTERLRPYIISNHADKLLQHLCRLRERNFNGELIQLHCVLDNSGYELATDLALLDFLHETGYVATVTIHTKAIPWYVSDVMRRDLFWTLRELEDSDHIATQALGERCQRRIKNGVWHVMDDVFWTQSFDYAEMATRRPDLYKILQSADLILFKGDLNYRKLVGDLSWHPTVSFKKALRGFEPTFVCALRTLKADTVAGIDPAIVSVVAQKSPDWMVTGEYAVIQCAGVECKEEPSLLPTPSDEASPKKSSTGTSVHASGTSASAHTAV